MDTDDHETQIEAKFKSKEQGNNTLHTIVRIDNFIRHTVNNSHFHRIFIAWHSHLRGCADLHSLDLFRCDDEEDDDDNDDDNDDDDDEEDQGQKQNHDEQHQTSSRY